MVVSPDHQSKGLGGQVLTFMLKVVANNRVSLNARLPAVGFYKNFGFTATGDPFVTASTGVTHINMVRYSPQ